LKSNLFLRGLGRLFMTNGKSSKGFVITVSLLVLVMVAGIVMIIYSRQPAAGYGEDNDDEQEIVDTPVSSANKYSNDNVSNEEILLEIPDDDNYGEELSFVEIAKKTGPSIVGLRITIPGATGFLNSGLDRPFAEGSGIIISEKGYVLTNYHVVSFVDPANTAIGGMILEVYLPDGRQTEAGFIGADPLNDLAVVKINLDNLPVAELGNSLLLEVGEEVAAIGNPLGLEFAGSVTTGVVSALNRIIEVNGTFLSLVQTDAAINPGNSGGALVDRRGRVIGVNSVKIAVEGVEGLGFAIPINDARDSAIQIIKYGYIKDRISIGITGTVVSQVIARLFGVPVGMYVEDVRSGSPAYEAGIRKGDIIVKLDGNEIKSDKEVYIIEKQLKKGDTIEVVFISGERQHTSHMKF
jgi:serine protease Do